MAASVNASTFWDVTPCILLQMYQRFRRTDCIHLHLHWRRRQRFLWNVRKLIYQTAQRYMPEESNHHYSKWLADKSSCPEFDGRKVQTFSLHSVTHMSRSPTS